MDGRVVARALGDRLDRDQRRRSRRRRRAATLTIPPPSGPSVIPAGGRGIDQDGNGTIDSTEGVNARRPVHAGEQPRRAPANGDRSHAARPRDPGRPRRGDERNCRPRRLADLYAGQSFGGIYGIDFVALEPAPAPRSRTSPAGRSSRLHASRRASGRSSGSRFSPGRRRSSTRFRTATLGELRGEPAASRRADPDRHGAGRVGDPGATSIETSGRSSPANRPARAVTSTDPVIVQFAKGDRTVPNPTTRRDPPRRRPRREGDVLPQRHRRAAAARSSMRTRTPS